VTADRNYHPPGQECQTEQRSHRPDRARLADEAYERYVGFLEAKYEPGRVGPSLPALSDDAGRVAPRSGMRRPS
jgi:hypothetical protein